MTFIVLTGACAVVCEAQYVKAQQLVDYDWGLFILCIRCACHHVLPAAELSRQTVSPNKITAASSPVSNPAAPGVAAPVWDDLRPVLPEINGRLP